MQKNNIRDIPSKAFTPIIGHQNDLEQLHFDGEFNNIGEDAFYHLNNLRSLNLDGRYSKLSNNSFHMTPTNKSLGIYFGPSSLTSFVFEEDTFSNIRRPTTISFLFNQITYLEEKVFLKFFEDNENNKIMVDELVFDCNDCGNYWLVKRAEIAIRMRKMKCSNHKYLNDKSNFKQCKIAKI